MNLIKDQWIPVIRADGSQCNIAPWEIGAGENPVVEIMAPRPDFRGALYQFLIGLVQTAFAPEDDDEWEERWNNPPSCEELKNTFYKFTEAFELVNENGPAFMQDYSMEPKEKLIHAKQLLFEIAGNPEHFVKHDTISVICEKCVATALFSLQTHAPEGGRGHRTGMRGGGPLTAIVLPENDQSSLWKKVWINILNLEDYFDKLPATIDANIFPWMGLTRVSKNDFKTFPNDVDELQMYWGLPRRIRLKKGRENQHCDICGSIGNEISGFYMETYGVCYGETWQHCLSPYRSRQEKGGKTVWLSVKGKQGGYAYPDWLSITLCNDDNEKVSRVVRLFNEKKRFQIEDNVVVWCFGYDMKKMKARCWYDQTMPIILIPADKQVLFIDDIQKMVTAADTAANLLQNQVKAAWFKRPKDAIGDTSFMRASFWEYTETAFYTLVYKIRDTIVKGAATVPILENWRKFIIDSAERLFDRFALQDTDEVKNMKRIAEASKALSNILRSPKTKSIQELKEVV